MRDSRANKRRRALTPLIRSQRSCDQNLMRAPASDSTFGAACRRSRPNPLTHPLHEAARRRSIDCLPLALAAHPPIHTAPGAPPVSWDPTIPGLEWVVLVLSWADGGESLSQAITHAIPHTDGDGPWLQGGTRPRSFAHPCPSCTVLGTCSSGIPVIRLPFFLPPPDRRMRSDPGA
jgi:hypothetical protein